MTKREILENVRQLTRDEQVDLAFEIWDLVDVRQDQFPLDDEQRTELDRRVAESNANPQPAEEFDALKARLLRGDF
jgi:putative addiction module component (TIGR02574 family)